MSRTQWTRLLAWCLAIAVCIFGCSDRSQSASGPPLLVAAVALSEHYVEVRFAGPVVDRGSGADDYFITAPNNTRLVVQDARVGDDPTRVVLTTAAQEPVEYQLTVLGESGGAAPKLTPQGNGPSGPGQAGTGQTTTFAGSTGGEPALQSAVALGNTQVLLTFSEPMADGATNPLFYRIVAANAASPAEDVGHVDILAAVLSADGLTVQLTTTPQAGIQYTVTVTNVKDKSGGKLIDPTASSATFYGIVPDDGMAPRVLSATATSSTTVVVIYSEPVTDAAADPQSYTISPPVVVTGAQLDGFRTRATLTTLPLAAGVPYTVTVSNVRDLQQNELDPAARSATFTFSGNPGSTDTGLPRVVGAASTGNTSVIVQFSKPMADDVLAATAYVIGQQSEQPQAGTLLVQSAQFAGPDRMKVTLTTHSQNELVYVLTVVGVTDLSGNPLAPKQIVAGAVIDPSSATFPGTPPSCPPPTCANGEPGLDGSGACASDDDCTATPPCGAPSTCVGACQSACSLVDGDGDGLSDNDEQHGWTVTVTLADGTKVSREVTSSIDLADTDGDGLSDALERSIGADPRNPDTDGDLLTDGEEYNLVYSDPTMQDTDGDGISDQLEVEFFKTSAISADSDGDGISDGDELFLQGRDPRLADVPHEQIVIGNVQLRIDERFTYTDAEGQTKTQSSSTSTTLDTATSTSRLDSHGVAGNLTVGIEDCQSDCKIDKPTDIAASLFLRAKLEGGVTTMTQTDQESAATAEQAFQSSIDKATEIDSSTSVTREVVGARIDVEVTLENPSDVAFELRNVELTVSTVDPQDPLRLVPVATLVPGSGLSSGTPPTFSIGPGQSRGPILFSNLDVYPSVVEDLMRAPRGLVFEVSNYDLITEDGRNFAFGLQHVRERTAGLAIDFGDGRVERYQATTAGVLDRPRDELRCAITGDHADQLCATDADCGTSAPCRGGAIVGGFSTYGGTGKPQGIPLDFLLRDSLHLRRTTPQVIVAGPNGQAESVAQGDDVQVVAPGTTGLAPGAVVIAPGKDGLLDTAPAGDDLNPTVPDGILAGSDGIVQSVAQGDDVQLVPVGTIGVPADTVVIGAGLDGVLQTAPAGDDHADVVTGYEVSGSCGPNTPTRILAGRNGRVDTSATTGLCLTAYAPHVPGETCFVNADCGQSASTGDVGVCGADVQTVSAGTQGLDRDAPVIAPGVQGVIASIPSGDDVLLGPGSPCVTDDDCRMRSGSALTGGTCSGPQVLVRVANRHRGQFRRFWAVLLADQSQFQTDFSRIVVRPGEMIGLSFIQDLDRDGLTADQELLFGSSDFKRDTDGDGLDDFVEARVGWDVGVVGQPLRRVFSDPRSKDSDSDGLGDREESDFRPLQCRCGDAGPSAVYGAVGASCRSDAECGAGQTCRDVVRCSLEDFLQGGLCPPCGADATLARTDPRRRDTDGDGVSDFDEVLGYHTGAGIVEPVPNVVTADKDLTASTVACPQNHCEEDPSQHCDGDGDCVSRRCVHPVPCDDVQVTPPGSGVIDPRTVVVAPGPYSAYLGSLVSGAATGDVQPTSAPDNVSSSHVLGDDVPVVGLSGEVSTGSGSARACADGSTFTAVGASFLPKRFLMCGVIKPGVDGIIESQLGGDDVLVPAGAGQRVEHSDPLSPDTDADGVVDGIERTLGSSPNDPGDTGIAGDRDHDGLTDSLESSGWTVSTYGSNGALCPSCPRHVASNPNVADTDLDGLPDYAEAHLPCFDDPSAECPTDPTRADSDGDGISDFDELSAAQLAELAQLESFFSGFHVDPSASKQYGTDPTRADTDGDGLTDRFELLEGWTVLLDDGSLRHVFSDPTRSDTDADGLPDYQELHRACYQASGDCPTDPTDADTDGDGRLDGAEVSKSTDPLTQDRAITVSFRRIEVDHIEDPGGAGGAEFGFWFLATSPSLGPTPTLVSTSDETHVPGMGQYFYLSPPGVPDGNGTCTAHCQCLNIELDPAQHYTLELASSTLSFALRKGDSFSLDGLLVELDAASNDCGEAPNYLPTSFASQCYTRFTKTYAYSDFANGGQGDTLAINPADTGVQGGDNCSWQVQLVIEVQ